MNKFDVVVIGGGHAGCEAYAASCRLNQKTALIVPSVDTLGTQPCNPAVGGPGKGHLVREIVALGGIMGYVTDKSGIQFRTLNSAKGPAVQSTRVQTDSSEYVKTMKTLLSNYSSQGEIIEDFAMGLKWTGDGSLRRIEGVYLKSGKLIFAKAVVVTTGTFLRGMLFIGDELIPGGRMGANPSVELAKSLEESGLPLIRLKTGTCPRIAADSIDFSGLESQPGDNPPPFFDPSTKDYSLPQLKCHITYTGKKSHTVINKNLKLSAMYSGNISGIGPRYCPSIETKIERFPEKERHQIFLEPEDKDGKVIYPAGLSTSFPRNVQLDMLHAIPGLENARVLKWGYAVEYDAVQPQSLTRNLEVESLKGLFLAGQIIGTSGYEEAAALGLIAGANAALSVKGEEPIILKRDEAYIGVMIDDLTGTGVDEPYRIFTSRAEFRLLLREDNSDERLYSEGVRTGLISKEHAERVKALMVEIETGEKKLRETVINPSKIINTRLSEGGLSLIKKTTTLYELAVREGCELLKIVDFAPWIEQLSKKALARLQVNIRYDGYLDRQKSQAKKLEEIDNIKFPTDMKYRGIPGLRGEIVEKLEYSNPQTLGQASRIPGVTPAAIDILQVYIHRWNFNNK
ncbi:MAG: tRNA uridine-5-carboxymethylaminomethyl(34) synthesis enzyme MnmG [Deltaproteobacteria bacterium]|nr:tRNA uridine-5-carboxymethylaminomethyl(34) synthesis enzyme MnmG [Deltaproteobacteria bacterium]